MSVDRELDGVAGHQLATVETAGALAERVMAAYVRPAAGGKVTECPLFVGIIDRVLSGWSSMRISRWLGEHGHSISHETLWSYRKRHIEPLGIVLQPGLRGLLENEVVVVDEVRELEELVTIHRARLRAMLLAESGVDDVRNIGENSAHFRHHPLMHKEIHVFSTLLERLYRLRREKVGLGGTIDDAVRTAFEQARAPEMNMASAKRVMLIFEQLQVIAEGGTEIDISGLVNDVKTPKCPRAELKELNAGGTGTVADDVGTADSGGSGRAGESSRGIS